MAIEAIKKKYPIRDENNRPSTYPTFASQVFGEDGDNRALWQAGKGFYADDSEKLGGKTLEEVHKKIIPSGGATGQVLTKASDADQDAQWADPSGGGTEIKLLWPNPSPSSSFAEQTVECDLSGYCAVLIKFRAHTSYTDASHHWWEVAPVGTNGCANYVQLGDSKGSVMVLRSYSVSQSGITFSNGGRQQADQFTDSDNSRAIPVEIYGIKGAIV